MKDQCLLWVHYPTPGGAEKEKLLYEPSPRERKDTLPRKWSERKRSALDFWSAVLLEWTRVTLSSKRKYLLVYSNLIFIYFSDFNIHPSFKFLNSCTDISAIETPISHSLTIMPTHTKPRAKQTILKSAMNYNSLKLWQTSSADEFQSQEPFTVNSLPPASDMQSQRLCLQPSPHTNLSYLNNTESCSLLGSPDPSNIGLYKSVFYCT